MQFTKTGGVKALLAAAVTAMIVMPIAIAGASGHTGSASSAKQIKTLKKQVAALAKQVSALSGKQAALEGKQAPVPASLPPNGPAGGVLTGTYPKPRLAANAVGAPEIAGNAIDSSEVADESLEGSDIKNGTIGPADIGPSAIASNNLASASVGAPTLKGAFPVHTDLGTAVQPNSFAIVTVSCPAGSRLLGGGFEWGVPNRIGDHIVYSRPSQVDPNNTWEVEGFVPTGQPGDDLVAEAVCLGG